MPTRAPFWQRRPLSFSLCVLLLFVVSLVLGSALGAVAQAAGAPETSTNDFAGLGRAGLASIVMAALLTGLAWWRRAGFVPRREWRDLRLAWVPALVIPLNLLGAIAKWHFDGLHVLVNGTQMLLTGFAEEAAFRGFVLGALVYAWYHRRGGVWAAVLVSSLLFSSLHALNLLAGAPLGDTLAQITYTFAIGVGFAALRLRTGTIWPAVVIHAVMNASSSAFVKPRDGGQDLATLLVSVVAVLLTVGLYGVVLLRHGRRDVVLPPEGVPAEMPVDEARVS